MIFLGPMYQARKEEELLALLRHGISNAPNQYQSDLIAGFIANDVKPTVINVLPVGTWPRSFRKPILHSETWTLEDQMCYEVGSVNLPVIKQWQREVRVKKLLRRLIREDQEVVVYSAYLPFLRAVQKLPKSVNVTLIVTDLPEYYDFGKVSALRRILRKMNNAMISRAISRVDRYVLLTEQMAAKMGVQNKPYTIVEGIWNERLPGGKQRIAERQDEKKRIFYAGTLHRGFGVLLLLDAFALMKDENLELWLCGIGDTVDIIEQRAASDKRIRYFGYVSSREVDELRKEASLLVNPRTNEGEYTKYSFPSKTMGYLASGIPTAMYKLDGIPDDYDRYLNYLSATTAEALAEELQKLLSTYSEMREKAQLGRQYILDMKNSKVQAGKILDMMDHS